MVEMVEIFFLTKYIVFLYIVFDRGEEMKKLKLYFDSSAISALVQDSKPERMSDMRTLWEMIKRGEYDVVLSNVLTGELNDIEDIEKREILFYYLSEIIAERVYTTDEMQEIAEMLVKCGILTENSFSDCQHIACALVKRCDIIVSYNFRHMVNVRVIKGVRRISFIEGYGDIDIMTAETLIEKGGES